MNQPHYTDGQATVWHGDCLDVLATLADASVDAVCTDPPYGLEFMGLGWDKLSPFVMADGANRINAPSWSRGAWQNKRCTLCGHIASGGSPCRCPEPEWTIETGKSNAAVHAFQAWCEMWAVECLRVLKPGGHMIAFGGTRTWHRLVCAVEDAGFEIRDTIAWLYGSGFPKSHNLDGDHEGWGTALKPGFEPAMVARKPLAGTVAGNAATHGTGALHIDACRLEAGDDYRAKCASVIGIDSPRNKTAYGEWTGTRADSAHDAGRWPTNVTIDDQTAADLNGNARYFPTFRYQAKAPTSERPNVDGVAHETVKPLDLMRWLVRLVTPAGGLVLDPFAGSGTTAEACLIEGFRCIAVEKDPKYLPLITARIGKPLQTTLFAA